MSRVVWEWGTLGASALLTALVLLVEHWFPWTREPTRVEAYVAGVSTLLAGFATWRLLCGDWVMVVGLGVIVMAGGLAVMGAYKVDGMVRRLRQGGKAERGDEELRNGLAE